RSVSLVLLSMPPLLTSLFLVFVAARTGWFPIAGMRSPGAPPEGAFVDLLRHLVLPTMALGAPLAAMLERLQSQAMSEVVGEPFVMATLARGVPRARVVWRDALKAALRPIAAVYGLIVGTLLSGSFAVEVISAWPGLGTLMLGALRRRAVSRLRHARLRHRARVRRSARQRHVARTGGGRVSRRLGLVIVAFAVAAAIGAPAVAPHGITDHFGLLLNAPPTLPRLVDDQGSLHAPFIYPWRRLSQLEQRYEEDRSV